MIKLFIFLGAILFLYLLFLAIRRYFLVRQGKMADAVDLKSEFVHADRHKTALLDSKLRIVTRLMKGKPIHAFTYASIPYSKKDDRKNRVRNALKTMASGGTMVYNTVHPPQYLVLSNRDLHLLVGDTCGDIEAHLVFKEERLIGSSLEEIPMTGRLKAVTTERGKNVKAYRLKLQTDGEPIEFNIFSCLHFANIKANKFSHKGNVRDIVVGNDFLKRLGEQYENLRVPVPILN